jgi:hypothetical protein
MPCLWSEMQPTNLMERLIAVAAGAMHPLYLPINFNTSTATFWSIDQVRSTMIFWRGCLCFAYIHSAVSNRLEAGSQL